MASRTIHASCILCVAMAMVEGTASADATAEQRALATTLFNEAKALLDAGRVPEACSKLEESQRIYPAGGTLLNLAVCHEREGKTASAWAEFREARVVAERDGREDRIALAESHRNAIEPKLSKLIVRVDPSSDLPNIDITADDHVLNRAAWGLAIPVNPGVHVISAVAPGKKRWSTTVTVLPDADVKTVVLPPWEDEAKLPLPPTVILSPHVSIVSTQRAPDRTAAITALSVGAGGVAMGAFFGILAIARHAQSNAACTTNPCSAWSDGLNGEARSAADVSTAMFVAGAVGLVVGASLWIFAGAKLSTRAAASTSWSF